MGVEIKRLGLQDVGNPTNGVWVEQDPTQYRFLGLNVLGWNRVWKAFKTRFLIPTFSSVTRASPFGRFVVVWLGGAHHGGKVQLRVIPLWPNRADSL
jgi:hypothetical protein